MERLGAEDLRKLLVQVQRLHEEPSLATYPAKAMACARALVESDWAAYEELNTPQNRTVGATDPPEARPGPGQIDVFMEHVREHPVIEAFTRRGETRARTISDFVSRSRYHATGIYNEFYKGMETEDQLGMFVAAPKPLTIVVALSRRRRSFTARDRTVFNVLQPHLLQAYRNAEAISALPRGAAWTIDALHEADQGAVWLARDGRIRDCTPKASQWLATYFPAASKAVAAPATAALPDALGRWVQRSRAIHESAAGADDVPHATPTFTARGRQGLLHVRLIPGRRAEGFLLLMTEQRDNPTEFPAADDPRLAALAPRYRRVLSALLAGRSEKEVALALGLSGHTVHEYVKHIYETLQVNTRAELLARWVLT